MKRDLKINYGTMDEIIGKTKTYKNALDRMRTSLKNINDKIEWENLGKSVNEVGANYQTINEYINSCYEELEDLENIFQGFREDMTSTIRPKNIDALTRVSRDDVYFNLKTIVGACKRLTSISGQEYYYYKNGSGVGASASPYYSNNHEYITKYTSEEEINRSNELKSRVSNINALVDKVGRSIREDVDELEYIFNNQIVTYEDMDDEYKIRAKRLYDKYSNFFEKLRTIGSGILVGVYRAVEGVLAAVVDCIVGILGLIIGICAVLFHVAAIGISLIIGEIPDKLKGVVEYAENFENGILAILLDPALLVENFAQGISDAKEEKGIAYVTAYLVTDWFLIDKVKDKLFKGKVAEGKELLEDTEFVKIDDVKGEKASIVENLEKIGEVSDEDVNKIEKVNEIIDECHSEEILEDVVHVDEVINIKYRIGYDKHLIEVEDIIRKKNKGVVGGHNFDNFKNAFKDKGWDVNECIVDIKEHPSIDGIYEVEYRLPALNNKGEIIPETYKNIPNPKTVYDPSKISNETIIKWGKEAMEEGIKNNRITNGREIDGYAKNGLKFKGYIDEETKEITNFFPTLK